MAWCGVVFAAYVTGSPLAGMRTAALAPRVCPPRLPCLPGRYERSTSAQKMSGARITQRHVASEEDLAYAGGKGLLVRAPAGGTVPCRLGATDRAWRAGREMSTRGMGGTAGQPAC